MKLNLAIDWLTRMRSVETQTAPTGFRKDIDGLRALAVLCVVANHFDARILPSGHLGVDIFFAISGFVITRSMMRRTGAPDRPFLVEFYVRRVKRIMPALIICVLVWGVGISLFTPNPKNALQTAFASLFGLANIQLYRAGSDYFATSTQLNAFTHLWSLGVEEQFYLFFPTLWIVLRGNSPRLRWILGAICALSLAAFLLDAPSLKSFYLTPFRLWELGLGCLLAALQRPTMRGMLLWKVVASLFIVGGLGLPASPLSAIAVVAGTGVLLFFGGTDDLLNKSLELRPVQFFGKISYSLYLWHWPILAISRATVGVHVATIPMQLGAMVLLAWLSYRYVETPLRRAKWSRSNLRTLALGGGAAFGSAAAAYALAVPFNGALYIGQRVQLAERGSASLDKPFSMRGLGYWAGKECTIQPESVGRRIEMSRCTFGTGPRVLVLGNSVAAAMVPAFELVAKSGRSVSILSAWGAAPVGTVPSEGRWERANADFWRRVAPDALSGLSEGDSVLLLSDLYWVDDTKLALFEQGLRTLAIDLGPRGIDLWVVDSLPYMRDANCEPEAAVRQWFAPYGTPCKFHSKPETLKRRAPLSAILLKLEKEGLLHRIDLLDSFCPGPICNYEASGIILYRDEVGHPSFESRNLVGPVLVRALGRLPNAAAPVLDSTATINRPIRTSSTIPASRAPA